VDAMDNEGIWYEAQILNEHKDRYYVRFRPWSEKYNMWIEKNSYNIAKLHTYTPIWRNNIQNNHMIDIKFENLWYKGTVLEKKNNSIWIKIHSKNNNNDKIIKMNINSDNIAHSGTHCRKMMKESDIYKNKYFTTQIVYNNLEKGMTPLYLNKKNNLYILLDMIY
jgi:hypothetical protein